MAGSIVSNSKKLGSLHLEQLRQLITYAQTENDVETILKAFSAAVIKTLGDPSAAKTPGNLKKNEHQFSVAGFFLHIPQRKESCLVAEQGFPAEQHRLRIRDDVGHPGWVTKHKKLGIQCTKWFINTRAPSRVDFGRWTRHSSQKVFSPRV